MTDRTADYNSEPVVYCPRCYSLRMARIGGSDDSCYCMDCGCTESAEAGVDEWERLYHGRYGRSLVDAQGSPRERAVRRLTVAQLKDLVYGSPRWLELIRGMYPGFPGGLGRADSVILFFDRLSRDGRIGALRSVLAEEKGVSR